jgi:hypothetical protein
MAMATRVAGDKEGNGKGGKGNGNGDKEGNGNGNNTGICYRIKGDRQATTTTIQGGRQPKLMARMARVMALAMRVVGKKLLQIL